MMAVQPRPGGLGRIVEKDLRDLNFLLTAHRPQVFATPIEKLPVVKHYRQGPILDQGQTGTCVAHGLVAKLRGLPVLINPPRCPAPFDLYDRATRVDEYAENDHDTERAMGTSVRAGCKVLAELGLISSYHWAYSTEEILQWVLGGQGGIVLGTDWYDWMSSPNPETGIMARPHGQQAHLEGGHCYYIFGADRDAGVVDIQNSWGPAWGGWLGHPAGQKSSPTTPKQRLYEGCARLPVAELDRLLKGNGEAAAIVEVPRRTPKKVVPA
jgi:hypothetical protein